MSDLTQAYLKECLHYDPSNGIFTWKERPQHHFSSERIMNIFNGNRANTQAGSPQSEGYIKIALDGVRYTAHRLAFLYMTGVWPEHQVDHDDRNPGNNSWRNLNLATNKKNCKNRTISTRNTSGIYGVYWRPEEQKWRAKMQDGETTIYLGAFKHKFEAACARKSAELLLGYHPNHGAQKCERI